MADRRQLLHERLHQARRERGMTQSRLAAEVGCKQSAISMMEHGRGDALSWETVEQIAKVLGVDLSPYEKAVSNRRVENGRGPAYCPNYDCPSNMPFLVGGRMLFLPRHVTVRAGDTAYCRLCGDVMERCCPNHECGTEVSSGACCEACGTPYVPPPPPEALPDVPQAWIDAQMGRITALGLAR